MTTPSYPAGLDARLWRAAVEAPDAGPARWDGAEVGEGVTLEVWVGPKNHVGSRYFRCYLVSELGRTAEPVVFGLQNAGPYPGYNWVEVIDYDDRLPLEDGREVEGYRWRTGARWRCPRASSGASSSGSRSWCRRAGT
jgi:hypothetical protein